MSTKPQIWADPSWNPDAMPAAGSPFVDPAIHGCATADTDGTRILQEWNRNIQGAEETILNGDLHLEAILASEKAAAHPNSATQQSRRSNATQETSMLAVHPPHHAASTWRSTSSPSSSLKTSRT
jgi:hypothetical protein